MQRTTEQSRSERGPAKIALTGERPRKLLVVVCGSLAVGLGMVAQRQLVDQRDEASGLILWAIAIAAFLGALWQARGLRLGSTVGQGEDAPGERALPLRAEAALLTAALAVGIFFRFYRIDSIPPGLNHDAAWNGLYALGVTPILDYITEPYVATAWGRETMFHQIIALFQSFLGPSEFAIQLAGISVGIATLVAFYLLMRRLFDTRLALVALFLLAVSGWHITMSKAGWRSILVPLLAALVFYFLVRAVQERRVRDFVIAGILLGLSLDTYDAARMLPFIAVTYVAYEVARRPSLARTHGFGFGILGIAALLAFAPLGWYALNHWDTFTKRGEFAWIGTQIEQAGSWEPLFTNAKNTVLLFNFRGNGADFFVKEPLLDLPVSVFFPLGLVVAMTRFRQRGYFLLLAMLFLALAVGIASEPNGNRNIVTVIPVIGFAAVFLIEAWRWLRRAFPGYQSWFNLGLVVVLLGAGYATYDSYLGPDRRHQWGFYPEATRVGRYMNTIAGEYEIHVAARNWPRDTLAYLSYQGDGHPFLQRYTYTSNAADLLEIPAVRQRTALIVEAGQEDAVAGLREAFPQARVDKIYYPDGSDRIVAYAFLLPESAPVGIDPAGAAERDAQRREDLLRIAAALREYRAQSGAFPDTGGELQTACLQVGVDVLCRLRVLIGRETLVDPRGATEYGYWYSSDGESSTLYALFEAPLAPDELCTSAEATLAGRDNLYCLLLE